MDLHFMNRIMHRKRYRRILIFFARVIISLIFWELLTPIVGLRSVSLRTRPDRLKRIAIRFRTLATEMGGVMIKVGQFLSTRVDVLPEEITMELSNLQDEVAPESFHDIRQVAELELGGSLQNFFQEFQEEPMAAASLGQVHQAILHEPENGIDRVVVKVQRPNIEMIIATDLAALKTVGRWIKRYRPISKRADVPALLHEFATITYEEIDYLAEGKNAETFAVYFHTRTGVRVPKVIWTHTAKRVLTLENVQAIKITDYKAISAAGIERAAVAQRLFETYLQQIFEDGFFHADPHPGNLFVAPDLPVSTESKGDHRDGMVGWTLNFVDFGMVGRVPSNIRAGLREMAIGIGTQDTARLVKSYQMLGVLLPGADLERIREMEAMVFQQFWGKSMTELQQINWDDMHSFAKEFREIIYEMPFQIPENLIFLGRCVAILAGMCTGLNPDFNVWEGLAPFARKIIQEETQGGWEYWRAEIGDWGKLIFNLPRRLDLTLQKLEQGKMAVDTPSLNRQAARLERTGRRLISSVVFAVFFFSGVQLFLADEVSFGVVLLVISTIPLWRSITPGRGHG
jgi:predicted unusual protein kinase regulating ubiquinone biosynthesis (AarF/ABC1/UbiB family)